MKNFILITLILISFTSKADINLCPGIVIEIEPDMRIPESNFSKEGALKALEELKLHIESEISAKYGHGWYNARTILTGYRLRSEALIEHSESGWTSKILAGSMREYCAFLSTGAFWYD